MSKSLRGVKSYVTELMSGADFALLVRGEAETSHDHHHGQDCTCDACLGHDHGDEGGDAPALFADPLYVDSPVGGKPDRTSGGGGGGKKAGGGGDDGGGGGGGKNKVTYAPTDISLTNAEIDETSAGGSVIGQLSATDVDKGEKFTFSLVHNPGNLFAISGNQLVVADGADLSVNADTVYAVTVQVTDKYGNTYQEEMSITVRDIVEIVNNAPTDIAIDNDSVAENSANGAVVGGLSATDPDGDENLTFTLLNDAGGRFAIVGGELVVANGALLDFESQTSHVVTVQVMDSQGATYQEDITITLTDVVEPTNQAPTDITLDGTTVIENAADGAVIGQLDGTDPDEGDLLSFSLDDDAGGRFAVEGGQLVVADGSKLDYETATSHVVTVRVTDEAGEFYTEDFTIAVTDLDETVQETPYYVEALIPTWNGLEPYRWNYPDEVGTSVVVTFTFLDDFASYYDPANMIYTDYTNDPVAFSAFTAAQVTAAYQILGEISDFTNVTFVEVATAAEADITFGAYYMDPGIGAYAYYAGGYDLSGDVWMNTRYDQYPTTSEEGGADWARSALAHEIGHAMGLRHPGDYDAGSGGTGELYLPDSEDNAQFTIMSYTDFPYSGYDPVDYMLYDIAALQYLYGANTSHATGDDVYAFNENANYIDTIWDAGGFDTFSAVSASGDVTLNLNDGSFSSVGLTENIGIAFGTEIESAIGGSGDDTLIANDLDNVLTGGAGADKFVFETFGGLDVITDFQDGVDLVDLSNTSLTFADLTLTEDAAGVDVAFLGSSIELADATLDQIGEEDFIFGAVA